MRVCGRRISPLLVDELVNPCALWWNRKKKDMAEATVVGALTQTFIAMVTHRLFDEVWMFTSFREEFEFLCDELISIKCLLNDAAEKSNSTLMCNWLDSLEDFLIDAEDIVEECCTTPKFCKLIFKYRLGRKIKILKERINKINRSARYAKYLSSVLHVNVLNAYNAEDLREKSSAFIRESHTLGMEHDIHIITNWILEDGYGVIAILGMGGLGKSLLLRHVFKTEKVREHFDHFIWLSVSQNSRLNNCCLKYGDRSNSPAIKIWQNFQLVHLKI